MCATVHFSRVGTYRDLASFYHLIILPTGKHLASFSALKSNLEVHISEFLIFLSAEKQTKVLSNDKPFLVAVVVVL